MIFTVRNAVTQDAEEFTRILWDGVKYWAGDSLPEVRRWFDENYTVDLMREKIASSGCFVAVNNVTGVIVGTVMISKIVIVDGECHAEIKSLYTDVKGEGIGSLLVETVLDVCRRTGVQKVSCSTWDKNVLAQKFLESKGFENTGIVSGIYNKNISYLIYSLLLDE